MARQIARHVGVAIAQLSADQLATHRRSTGSCHTVRHSADRALTMPDRHSRGFAMPSLVDSPSRDRFVVGWVLQFIGHYFERRAAASSSRTGASLFDRPALVAAAKISRGKSARRRRRRALSTAWIRTKTMSESDERDRQPVCENTLDASGGSRANRSAALLLNA